MLSPGDTILTEYAGCIEVVGEVIDGTIDSEVDAFDGSILGAYDMTMTMNFSGLPGHDSRRCVHGQWRRYRDTEHIDSGVR